MAKKLSEMTVDPPKEKTPTPGATTGAREVSAITTGMAKQIKLYGKRIPYTELEEVYNWMFLNIGDLVTTVDHYLRTYNNPKREPAKVGGITDRRNKRIAKMKEFLIKFEKKRE